MEGLCFANNIWKESTRRHSVDPQLGSMAAVDVTVKRSGVGEHAGTVVYESVRRMRRNPGVWSDTEEFRPEQWGDRGVEAERVPCGAKATVAVAKKT